MDGLETWRDLKTEHGFDDTTVTSLTPNGGMHFLFDSNGAKVRNSAGKLGPCVDVRGEGGYVVVPPSSLASGGEYVWDVGAHPDEVKLTSLPEELVRLLEVSEGTSLSRAAEVQSDDIIPQGRRNNTLASLAGTMRRRAMTESEITAALLEVNRNRCMPPLAESEVRRIAESISRYEPSPSNSLAETGVPGIDTQNRNLPDITRRSWDALCLENERNPFLFRFGGLPCQGRDKIPQNGQLKIPQLKRSVRALALLQRLTQL